MNIGDRVRLLHHKEEGIVTRLMENNLVEVTIGGDFPIQVLKRDLAPVAREEAQVFAPDKQVGSTPSAAAPRNPVAAPLALKGLSLGLVPVPSSSLFSVYLLNNSDLTLLVTLGYERGSAYEGLWAGTLEPKNWHRLESLDLSQHEASPLWLLEALRFHKKLGKQAGFSRRLRLKPQHVQGQPQTLPLLGQKGFLVQLDTDEAKAFHLDELREKLSGGSASPTLPDLGQAQAEVDLHIEKLRPDHASLKPQEMLAYQLEVFERVLHLAHAAGLPRQVLIHGSGNGTLKNEIHKRLSKLPFVAFFRDARKDKFGYGATEVEFV